MRIVLFLFVLPILFACNGEDFSPKPRGYYRISLPKRSYAMINTGCPFVFEIPTYSILSDDDNKNTMPCWKNLDFPQFNARLHISYFNINPNATFEQLSEDARTFAFKHTSMATAIQQTDIVDLQHSIYGLEYDIEGNTASNYQFFISDKTKHYLRGALYFNEKPNLDSIQPVLNFIKQDLKHLIATARWK